MKILSRPSLLALLGLALIAFGSSARADNWDLRMLDGGIGGTPVASTLTYDLGTWTAGSLPGSMDLNFYALLRNLSDSEELTVSGYYDGFSGAAPQMDGRTWWTSQGENHLGEVVSEGEELTAWLGTFDASAFLYSLPTDGSQYAALIDFTYVADDSLGAPFDPDNHPFGITPGPPSLRIYGRVNPTGDPNVIPEASTFTLLGTMGLWAAPLGLWRFRRLRKQEEA